MLVTLCHPSASMPLPITSAVKGPRVRPSQALDHLSDLTPSSFHSSHTGCPAPPSAHWTCSCLRTPLCLELLSSLKQAGGKEATLKTPSSSGKSDSADAVQNNSPWLSSTIKGLEFCFDLFSCTKEERRHTSKGLPLAQTSGLRETNFPANIIEI